MGMPEVKKLIEMLKDNFGHPYLKKGFLIVEDNGDKTVTLSIGRRSITFNKNFRVLSAGTVISGNKMHEDEADAK